MSRLLGFGATLILALSLAACAGTPKAGCCEMAGAAGCKSEGKAMKCDMKEKAGGCCSKGAEGKPSEGHQH
jgi:hypothetical protein